MACRTFSIFGETTTLEPERAYPLFHLAQVASLEAVMTVYSLFPKAITARTKCGGFTPHHLAAASRNDDVLLFGSLEALVFEILTWSVVGRQPATSGQPNG